MQRAIIIVNVLEIIIIQWCQIIDPYFYDIILSQILQNMTMHYHKPPNEGVNSKVICIRTIEEYETPAIVIIPKISVA